MSDTAPDDAFFALQAAQADQAADQAAEAPYGYMKDPETGETRPKKTAGRPRKSPSLDDLKAEKAAEPPRGPGESGDRAPEPPGRGRNRGRTGTGKPAEPVPAQPSAGVIARGVNKLYRRAGKIVRAMDADIGEAVIQAARNTADEGDPDDSVGAAWEELARTNPRIRKFILKCIAGGAWGQLVMAHAPIAMAVVMKPAVMRLIPFSALIESMAEPDEDTPAGEGGLPGGMTADDAQQMAALAEQQIQRMGLSVPPEVREQMAQMAASMMNIPGPPFQAPAQRPQPRNRTRAERKRAG